jgi:arylsulfatase A
MRKSTYIAGVIGTLLMAVAATARQPNIVFILADDVGREVLGCYGGTSYATPNIDRLAGNGIRYRQAYTMPVCHPTRISLLTGQYPFRLGHPEWGSFPRGMESRTLPAVLKRAGYATAVAGKWQLAMLKDDLEQPHRMGFDAYCLYGWHEGPWYYQPYIWQDGKRRTDVRDRYGPDVMCDFLISFIEQHKDGPFFAYYPMSLCHAETNDLDQPAPFGPQGRYDNYAEMVAKMDERVGRIVAALERLELRESTLVVYFSDNGTAEHNLIGAKDGEYIYEKVVSKMGDRGIPGGKATLTDRGTGVPLIVNWPGTIDSGKVSDDLVDVSDFLPSLAGVAAAKLPADVRLDGHSLTAQMRNNEPPRHWVFAEHEGKCFVRNQRWKLYNDGLLYDMDGDPDERKPLAKDSLSPGATAAQRELQQALDELKYRPPTK